MLGAIGEVEFTHLLDSLQHAAEDTEDPIAIIKSQSHAYVQYAVAHPAFFEILFEFRPAWATDTDTDDLPIVAKTFEVASTPIAAAIAQGQLREVDPLIGALTIWAAVHGIATLLVRGSLLSQSDEDTLVNSVIDTILAGLAPE